MHSKNLKKYLWGHCRPPPLRQQGACCIRWGCWKSGGCWWPPAPWWRRAGGCSGERAGAGLGRCRRRHQGPERGPSPGRRRRWRAGAAPPWWRAGRWRENLRPTIDWIITITIFGDSCHKINVSIWFIFIMIQAYVYLQWLHFLLYEQM